MKFKYTSQNSTEWEDSILFDSDDPDFIRSTEELRRGVVPTWNARQRTSSFTLRVCSPMSMASIHGPQMADFCSSLGRSNISVSSSLSDLVGSPLEIAMDNVISIEELRAQMVSCFSCGVTWTDDHVSLDCGECGGYSLERPCPLCDGKCGVLWKRDFTMSHACSKARWHGVCPMFPEATFPVLSLPMNGGITSSSTSATPASCAAAASQLHLAQELCARLEQLSASART